MGSSLWGNACILLFLSISSAPHTLALRGNEQSCVSLYISIEDFEAADEYDWNGVYTLASHLSYNASIWTVSSQQWLKYIESNWVLSGANGELLIYQSEDDLQPPFNQTTTWLHEYHTDSAQISLQCSSSLSPTNAPTAAPTFSPTYSPTPSDCNILLVSESESPSTTSYNSSTAAPLIIQDWRFYKLSGDDGSGRPIWRYQNEPIEGYVQYFPSAGWALFVNTGRVIVIFSMSSHLQGFFPIINEAHYYDQVTNDDFPTRSFLFSCLTSDYPTHTPTSDPTLAPTSAPSSSPTQTPTSSPNGAPSPPPTSDPSPVPTIAPSLTCTALQIAIPDVLRTPNNNNVGCSIDFGDVFDSTYFLQHTFTHSERPSWTLDCDDRYQAYTEACARGYSGALLFISAQWMLQVHSKSDDCFEHFFVGSTMDHFVPVEASWTQQSTGDTVDLNIVCLDRVLLDEVQVTQAALVETTTVVVYEQIWFWISFLLLLLMCVVCCVAVWCWRRSKEPVVVYEPRNVKSVSIAASMTRTSRQDLELQGMPSAAFNNGMTSNDAELDEDVAPAADDEDEDGEDSKEDGEAVVQIGIETRDGDRRGTNVQVNVNAVDRRLTGGTLQAEESVVPSEDGGVGLPRMGSTAHDPAVNPNLKQHKVVVTAATGQARVGETLSPSSGEAQLTPMESDHDHDDLWNVDQVAQEQKDEENPGVYNALLEDPNEEEESVSEFVVNT